MCFVEPNVFIFDLFLGLNSTDARTPSRGHYDEIVTARRVSVRPDALAIECCDDSLGHQGRFTLSACSDPLPHISALGDLQERTEVKFYNFIRSSYPRNCVRLSSIHWSVVNLSATVKCQAQGASDEVVSQVLPEAVLMHVPLIDRRC